MVNLLSPPFTEPIERSVSDGALATTVYYFSNLLTRRPISSTLLSTRFTHRWGFQKVLVLQAHYLKALYYKKYYKILILGSWNVRTLLDNPTKRPERQTALVALELERYNIDVCCLQETRFPGQGQLCEKGCTFYWSGRNPKERREAGVAFAIANNIAKDLVCFPQAISDRLIKLRLPLNDNRHLTIICCYAPTMNAY